MRRGTTPTLSIKVRGLKFDDVENMYITLKQPHFEIVKSGSELMLLEQEIKIKLTQEETLKFSPQTSVQVQLRATLKDGNVVASDIELVQVKDIIQEGVIT